MDETLVPAEEAAPAAVDSASDSGPEWVGGYKQVGIDPSQLDPSEVAEALKFHREREKYVPVDEAERRVGQKIHEYLSNPQALDLLGRRYGFTRAQARAAAEAASDEQPNPYDQRFSRLEQMLEQVVGHVTERQQQEAYQAQEREATNKIKSLEDAYGSTVKTIPGAEGIPWLKRVYWAEVKSYYDTTGKVLSPFQIKNILKKHVDDFNGTLSAKSRAPRIPREVRKAAPGAPEVKVDPDELRNAQDEEVVDALTKALGFAG